jgi:hypothetical protein
VVDVGDTVDEPHDLALERRRLAAPRVVEDAVPHLRREVEPAAVPFQDLDDAEGLLVVTEAVAEAFLQNAVECLLAGVTEWRMPEVVSERDRLRQILVETKRSRDRA